MAVPSTRLSVLVVDDDRDTADSLAMVLQLHGFVANAAYSGAEAFDCVFECPDVVILDLYMPKEDGWALARRFSRLTKPPMVIAMTGSALDGDGDRHRSEKAGVWLHLVKPLDLNLLVASLHRIAAATENRVFVCEGAARSAARIPTSPRDDRRTSLPDEQTHPKAPTPVTGL